MEIVQLGDGRRLLIRNWGNELITIKEKDGSVTMNTLRIPTEKIGEFIEKLKKEEEKNE